MLSAGVCPGIWRLEPTRIRFGLSMAFAPIRRSMVVPNCFAIDRSVSPAWT